MPERVVPLRTFEREDIPQPEPPPTVARARPFVWRDPTTIPRREWLYGGHYIRRFITTTVAPGGLGKSSLILAEAMAMASGKPLLGERPSQRLRVWYWNGEDPAEETERRVHAVARHHGLVAADLEGWLFTGTGRANGGFSLANQTREGAKLDDAAVAEILELIRTMRADVVIIDPFVASHTVTENDNNAVAMVAAAWAGIADETNAAVELVHHVRKGSPSGDRGEITVEDGRGAVALLAAARSARTLNPMTKAEATDTGVERHRSYFRVDNGKANMAPPPEGSTWFHFVGVDLGNGDNVGAVAPWTWPDAFADVSVDDLLNVQRAVAGGEWRESDQSPQSVGHAIADALKLNLASKPDKAKVRRLLKRWISTDALRIVEKPDAKSMPRKFVEVGSWADQ